MTSTSLARANAGSSALSARFSSPATPSQKPGALGPAEALGTPQPGAWRHPSLDEIARRQNATKFNGDNINMVVTSGIALLVSFYLPNVAYSYTPNAIISFLASFGPVTDYTLVACRLLLALNIALACLPLLRYKDDIDDIPLTPSQRALLGLKPSSLPLTPGQEYITPPRYARSSTPRSSGSAQRVGSSSPLSARAASPSSLDRSSIGQSKHSSGSPYTSPLVQKAIGGASAARRLSYSSSPLDMGPAGNGNGSLPAAAPTTGLASGKASVGLNSKWLYERGRRSPNGKALFT